MENLRALRTAGKHNPSDLSSLVDCLLQILCFSVGMRD